jgi:putative flippase GtrA
VVRYRFFTAFPSEKLRFIIVGIFNTIFGLSLFPVLFFFFPEFSSNYLMLMIASHVVCVIVSFLTQKFFAFGAKGQARFEIITFLFFHVSHLFAGMVFVEYVFNAYGISPGVVQPTYTLIMVIFSYFWYSKVSFRRR